MDKISRLPDELLLKVLLFLPTKVAVSTSILSKRWEFLWMWLSKLVYVYYSAPEQWTLRRFIKLNLPLHKAQVIESLRLKFIGGYPELIKQKKSDCGLSLQFLAACRVKLPSSLYTCRSLVALTLIKDILVDVPRLACLPSLKRLILQRVAYKDKNSLGKLLSSCPILEDLVLEPNVIDYINEAFNALYRDGIVFNQLQHLKICSCDSVWSKLLLRILKDSPNLRELEVYLNDKHRDSCADPSVCWENQLDCVPPCLLSSLETFKWTGINGSQKEIDLIKYVLRNAIRLKAATILFRPSNTADEDQHNKMLMHDLSHSFR
ncbi:unnamed protein product, partial [Thlaspi arvense]